MMHPEWVKPGARMSARKLLGIPLIQDPRWVEWFRLAGIKDAKPQFVAARFPNYELEAVAAAQGIGAALLSRDLFMPMITQGTLAAPFETAVKGPDSYWLLWTKNCADAHFLTWMKSQFDSG